MDRNGDTLFQCVFVGLQLFGEGFRTKAAVFRLAQSRVCQICTQGPQSGMCLRQQEPHTPPSVGVVLLLSITSFVVKDFLYIVFLYLLKYRAGIQGGPPRVFLTIADTNV